MAMGLAGLYQPPPARLGQSRPWPDTCLLFRTRGVGTRDQWDPGHIRLSTSPLPASDLDELERRLGFRFLDRSYLSLALIHASYVNENPESGLESNERSEFLGDAVVDLAVGHVLFGGLGGATEGELTAVRSLIVRSETLARAAARLGIGDFLVLGKGERASGGAGRVSNLGDAFEALVGAVFLDRGYQAARDFVVAALEPEIALAMETESPKDPKSRLQELAQANGLGAPVYRILSSDGPDHLRRFTVEAMVAGQASGVGSGARKVDAEREAASRACEALASRVPSSHGRLAAGS
ncbi:MAG: ribonuclease III [SAR202 cluster bacterium]|nr:ribonuclease III [SAR202 cluster bacterium]